MNSLVLFCLFIQLFRSSIYYSRLQILQNQVFPAFVQGPVSKDDSKKRRNSSRLLVFRNFMRIQESIPAKTLHQSSSVTIKVILLGDFLGLFVC